MNGKALYQLVHDAHGDEPVTGDNFRQKWNEACDKVIGQLSSEGLTASAEFVRNTKFDGV